ncbi:MAG: hypothetical protein MUE84_08360 [Hyphomonas sp.]|nr:hypothetical protein [Hyphomonas sp.]
MPKSMRGFKALVALGHVLCEDRGPEAARAAFDVAHAVFFAGTTAPTSRAEQHRDIYRRWTEGAMPEHWLPVTESILLHHPPTWIDYIASLNGDDLPAAPSGHGPPRCLLPQRVRARPHWLHRSQRNWARTCFASP